MKKVFSILVALATFFLFSSVAFADTVFFNDDFSSWEGGNWKEVETFSPSDYSVRLSFDLDSPDISFTDTSSIGSSITNTFGSRYRCHLLSVSVLDKAILLKKDSIYKASFSFTFSSSSYSVLSTDSCRVSGVRHDILAKKVSLSGNNVNVQIIFKCTEDYYFSSSVIFENSSNRVCNLIDLKVSSASLSRLSDYVEPEPEPEPEPDPNPDLGDISIYDDWDIVSTSPIISGSSDTISGQLLLNNSVIVNSSFSATGTTTAELDDPSKAPFNFNGMDINFRSSFAQTAGDIYRLSGSISLTSSGTPDIKSYQISDGTVLAFKSWTTDSNVLFFDIVYKADTTRTLSLYFRINYSVSSSFGKYDSIIFSGNTVSHISEHQTSIEEWLEAIYSALVGESGEGGGTSNPELDESVSQAGQLQGSLDEFESSIQGDFESSFNDLNLGGFKLPVGILSAMSWIGTTWTGFFNGMGELQYIILFPCFVGLALLLIGRAGMAMHIVSMKKDRSKKGGES